VNEGDCPSVNELPIRPHVARASLANCRIDVDGVTIVQNSSRNVWRQTPKARDCAVVERMHRTVDCALLDDVGDTLLDAFAFDLDVNATTFGHDFEHLSECRNSNAFGQANRPELRKRKLGDCASTIGIRVASNRRVVVDHDLAVDGGVNVELDGVSAALEGSAKGWKRVFRKLARRTAMTNAFCPSDAQSRLRQSGYIAARYHLNGLRLVTSTQWTE
jgi:hypothetical protein